MKKPTGKQRRALERLERRLTNAVHADQVAKTPGQKAAAKNNGIRALLRMNTLTRLFDR